MGSYETEQALIAQGKAERGQTALAYLEDFDAGTPEVARTRHPDYTKTLFAPENDDIYREFCSYVDMPKPRYFDAVPNPMSIEGYTAADVYRIMIGNNYKLADVDAAAVYNMMVTLREKPQIAKRVLAFRPTCAISGAC